MIWLLLIAHFWAVNAKHQQDAFLQPSLPDAVRVGATILSRFLNQQPPRIHFSPLYSFEGTQPADKGTQGGGQEQKNGFVLTFLRLMGVDQRKINDFAFDGIISMVHLMSRVLLQDGGNSRKGRKTPMTSSFFRFVLGQPRVADLMKKMQDPHLIDLLLKESKKKVKNLGEGNAECIHLLICKTKPFVRGMQRSFRFFAKRENVTTHGEAPPDGNYPGAEETCPGEKSSEERCRKESEDTRWEEESLEGRMYFFLPDLRDVIEEGDECDRLFPNCIY